MSSLKLSLLLFSAFIAISVGCAKPQVMSIETSPPGAAISVDGGYVGRSPVQIRLRGVKKMQQMKVVAELEKHDLAAKVVDKASNGRFPKQVFLMLSEEQAPTSGAGGMGMQQGGTTTTVQGPTIVIPNMGPAPQVAQPQPYPPQYQQPQQPYPPQYQQQYPQQYPQQQQPYPAQYPQQPPQYPQQYQQQPQYEQPLQRGLDQPESSDEESEPAEQ